MTLTTTQNFNIFSPSLHSCSSSSVVVPGRATFMETTMKTCTKCKVEKPKTEFYKHKGAKDGLTYRCKSCACRNAREWQLANIEKARENQAKWYLANAEKHKERARNWRLKNPERSKENGVKWVSANREKRNSASSRYRKRFPEKIIAHRLLNNSIKSGKLKRMPCELCGKPNSQAHHDDYSKPLEVRWLCVRHHQDHHNNERRKESTNE